MDIGNVGHKQSERVLGAVDVPLGCRLGKARKLVVIRALNDPPCGLLDIGVLYPSSGAVAILVGRDANGEDPQDGLGDDRVKRSRIKIMD